MVFFNTRKSLVQGNEIEDASISNDQTMDGLDMKAAEHEGEAAFQTPCTMAGLNAGLSGGAMGFLFGFGEEKGRGHQTVGL